MVFLCRVDRGDAAFLFSLYHKIAGRARGCEANHAEGVYGIRNLLRYGIATKERMESSRSDVWHQSEGEIHAGA